MTDEEIEVVAEELAKAGGVSWYPGREKGTLMRVVSDRYRERARVAIEALDRFRASRQDMPTQDPPSHEEPTTISLAAYPYQGDEIRPGATVVYRPPGDRRAYPCRVVEVRGEHASLEPILRAWTGWVSLKNLQPEAQGETIGAQD